MIFFNPRLIDLRSEQFEDIECSKTNRGMSKCGTTENMHFCLSSSLKHFLAYRLLQGLLNSNAILILNTSCKETSSIYYFVNKYNNTNCFHVSLQFSRFL